MCVAKPQMMAAGKSHNAAAAAADYGAQIRNGRRLCAAAGGLKRTTRMREMKPSPSGLLLLHAVCFD
jgi:hypothetical protein